LRPNWLFVATLASRADRASVEPDWLGVPMYFSDYNADDSRRFILDAGLQVDDSPKRARESTT
jgi:hypothetical protein